MDPYAQFENSKTKEFKDAVNQEIKRWNTARKPDASTWFKRFKSTLATALPKTPKYAQTFLEWQGHTIHIQDTYNHQQNVWFNNALKYEAICTFALGKTTYAKIQDTGKGSEEFTLTVYSSTHKKLWDATPVGPELAYKDNHVYFQTVENRLRYPGVQVADELKGTPTLVFEEPDKKVQLELIKPPFQDDVFIKAANALTQRLGMIVGSSEVKWLTSFHLSSVYPIDKHTYIPNIALPKNSCAVDGIRYDGVLYVITVKKGQHTLYEIKDTLKPIKTCPSIKFLKQSPTPTVLCEYHWKPAEVYDILQSKVTLTYPSILELNHQEGLAGDIPYTIVYKGKPTQLIVSAYGAYGIEAQRGYPIRWLPWIEKGYAFAVAMPRGGRDDGDAWWDAARTAPRKHRTFEDTAKVIETVQKRLHILPKRTIFYGRSAGGWVAAMMALQYPHLVRGVIAEVPYVDVLRTTSNSELPLTQMEFEEFGDPLHEKKDYNALLKISPVDITDTPPKSPPTILIKTALNDTQVATYEALKWAATLREKGWPNVYVSIDTNGGHFVGQDNAAKQYADDAAFFQPTAGLETRRTANHLSRGITRRSKSASKH
jgi:protease II